MFYKTKNNSKYLYSKKKSLNTYIIYPEQSKCKGWLNSFPGLNNSRNPLLHIT